MAKKAPTRPRNTSPDDPVTAYAEAVKAGDVIAGPHIRNACRRHLLDLAEGPKRGLRWDRDAAQRAISFFADVLQLAGGQFEGTPFVLQPSQKFKTGALFGWKRADGTRRFRRAYIEEAKGAGKSPWAAGIGHYCLLADGEPRAEVYAAAANTAQAMVLFRDAVAMREQSPALASRLTPSGGNPVWNLADLKTGSFFRPISSEARKAGSGPRPSCALCDEVHEHPDGLTVEMLERGFKWRRQPLLIMTTNSGSDRNSPCWQEHEHAVRVAAGTRTPDEHFTFVGETIDDTTFSFVCGLDPDDDPLEDPSCWIKANPLLGVTMKYEHLEAAAAMAKLIPGKLNGILRLNFCVWTDADQAWMSRATLDAVLADFDPAEHAGEDAYVGIDLSATSDLTAMAFVVPTGTVEIERTDKSGAVRTVVEPTFDAWVEAWTPAATMRERALKDKAPYDVWAERGHLTAIPGNKVKLIDVAVRLAEASIIYRIILAAYDRYAFRKFEEDLESTGVDVPFIEHPQGGRRRAKAPDEAIEAAKNSGTEAPQGLWMPGSVNELETLILERRIRIRRNPMTVSACMSAVFEADPFDNRWFSKRKATNRIDALVALAMAVGAATTSSTPRVESVYEQIARDRAQALAHAEH